MTAPIDPARRIAQLRKVSRAKVDPRRSTPEGDGYAADTNAAAPLPNAPADEAAFNAHKLGQERRRGLRAGHGVLDTAKSSYIKTEWSGGADRRAPSGWIAKTKI